jgi:anti-sigma regulatory factor (Ser/Thr protein kinase)
MEAAFGHFDMEPTMTTMHTPAKERTRRRALDTAEAPRGRRGTHAALDMSIARRPDPKTGGLSQADAAWPKRLRRIIRAALNYWGRPDLIDGAELLLSELATNALQHAQGPDIGVRVYLRDDECVIEVNDGSPRRPVLRCAEPDHENGRGLLIIRAVASDWGVNDDSTTTWCTLSLAKGLRGMEPTAATAPVVHGTPSLQRPADSTSSSSVLDDWLHGHQAWLSEEAPAAEGVER